MNKFKTILRVVIRFAFDVGVLMFIGQLLYLILNKLFGVPMVTQDSALFGAVVITIINRIYQWSKNND